MKWISFLFALVALAIFALGASVAHAAMLPVVTQAAFACGPSRIQAAWIKDNSACCRFVCNHYKCFCVWRC